MNTIDFLMIIMIVAMFHGAFIIVRMNRQLKKVDCMAGVAQQTVEMLTKDAENFVKFKQLKLYSIDKDKKTATIQFNSLDELNGFIETRHKDDK